MCQVMEERPRMILFKNDKTQNRFVKGGLRRTSFTLIELMIVLVILGLLGAIVGPQFLGKVEKAERQSAKTQIDLLSSSVKDYYLDVNEYPPNLKALVKNPGNEKWDGPYLDPPKLPEDPWDEPYKYKKDVTVQGRHLDFDIVSYGADNSPGGEGKNEDIHRISLDDN